MPPDVKKFLWKAFILSIPALLLVGAYVVLDPFKVLRAYDSYYITGINRVGLNRDYASTETFQRYNGTYHYDSFIFGSSRSLVYEVKDWQPHIQSTRCFHFDASNESLYGIHAKLNYLDQIGAPISNALLIVDNATLATTSNSDGHIFRKHPRLSGESRWRFQLLFLKTFFNLDFLTAYLHFKLTNQFHDYMAKGNLLNDRPMVYELASNESHSGVDDQIAQNPAAYYAARTNIFYPRSGTEAFNPPVLGAGQQAMLADTCALLRQHHCNYKIVISPLYDQKRMATQDVACLQTIFGRENVFDFSGINPFTQSYTNYYESSHYRPHVAREIMDRVYKGTS